MTRARGTSKHRRNARRNEARRAANLLRNSRAPQPQQQETVRNSAPADTAQDGDRDG